MKNLYYLVRTRYHSYRHADQMLDLCLLLLLLLLLENVGVARFDPVLIRQLQGRTGLGVPAGLVRNRSWEKRHRRAEDRVVPEISRCLLRLESPEVV
jgi:hypothetical protein